MHGITNCVLLAIYVNVTGNFVLLNYAVPVFEKSGSRMDPSYSTILMALLQISGCICSTQLSDKLGRKYMMTISMFGSAFGQIICALYVFLMESNVDVSAFHWVPVASVLFVLFMASTGIIPLAVLAAIELLPTKVFYAISFIQQQSLIKFSFLADSRIRSWSMSVLHEYQFNILLENISDLDGSYWAAGNTADIRCLLYFWSYSYICNGTRDEGEAYR